MGGYVTMLISACTSMYSLRLNSEMDVKHLMLYGRTFQYFGTITDKADSE